MDDAAENRMLWSEDRYAWLLALIEAGFTRAEAMSLLTKPDVVVQSGPEFSELATKMSALVNRDLSEGV